MQNSHLTTSIMQHKIKFIFNTTEFSTLWDMAASNKTAGPRKSNAQIRKLKTVANKETYHTTMDQL